MNSGRLVLLVGVCALLIVIAALGLLFMQTSSSSEEPAEEAALCGDDVQFLSGPLQAGDRAPDFKLPDHKGGFVRLSDYRGQSNVVLAFYPAAWTPV